jgi:hypothetical protein
MNTFAIHVSFLFLFGLFIFSCNENIFFSLYFLLIMFIDINCLLIMYYLQDD